MLEKPAIADTKIISCLQQSFDLSITHVEFLPLGADRDTAVYRAETPTTTYFVKLRRGDFNEMTVIVPDLLYEHGNQSVIAPMKTQQQTLWTALDEYKLMVFPYVEGKNGYQREMLDSHWVALGHALQTLHHAEISVDMLRRVRQEDFSDHWRTQVRQFLMTAVMQPFDDPIAHELAVFLQSHTQQILNLVERSEYLASVLTMKTPPFTLCHADIHAGNILIDTHDRFFIVDWDTLIFAPKERDLMYVGGGQFVNHRTPQEEEQLFYQGYGQADVDPVGLAYYRYERIVEDIAVYCEDILLTTGDSPDRKNGLHELTSQFQPNAVVDIAYLSEQHLPPRHQQKV